MTYPLIEKSANWELVQFSDLTMIPPSLETLYTSKRMIVMVVYLSMFLDNILLTVVGKFF